MVFKGAVFKLSAYIYLKKLDSRVCGLDAIHNFHGEVRTKSYKELCNGDRHEAFALVPRRGLEPPRGYPH